MVETSMFFKFSGKEMNAAPLRTAMIVSQNMLTINPMTDGTEHRLSLRQADAARADLYAIHDELDFIKTQIARLPTRRDLARIALLSVLGGAALAIVGVELLTRLYR
jgi:hypothetical protein